MMVAAIDWTNVLVALIAGLPAIIAAIGVLAVHKKIKTPSGKSIGEQVEDALHAAYANSLRLQSLGGETAQPTAQAIKAEAERANGTTDTAATPPIVPPETV